MSGLDYDQFVGATFDPRGLSVRVGIVSRSGDSLRPHRNLLASHKRKFIEGLRSKLAHPGGDAFIASQAMELLRKL